MKPRIALIAALALTPAAAAWAHDVPATCKLQVVNALPGNGGIDPAIQRLRPYLERPPFNAWKTFKLISANEAAITPGGTASYAAPNGTVVVTYTGHRVEDGKHAVQGSLEVQGAKTKARTVFTLSEGKFFVVAGEKFGEGTLIYSLSCKTAD